jgi:hypothetical protein
MLSPRAFKVLAVRAAVYAASGRNQEAQPLVEQALSIADTAYGRGHRATGYLLKVYAAIERRLNHKAEAKVIEKRAKFIQTNSLRNN